MAAKRKQRSDATRYWPSGERKLTFYDLHLDKAAKEEIAARLGKGQFTVNHLADIVGEHDKLSFKPDSSGTGWSVFLTWQPIGHDEPVGVYTVRAKHLANAIAGLIWRSEDFDERHFIESEDDDF